MFFCTSHQLFLALFGLGFRFITLNCFFVILYFFFKHRLGVGIHVWFSRHLQFQFGGSQLVGGLTNVFSLIKSIGIGCQDIFLSGLFHGIGATQTGNGQNHGQNGNGEG